MTKRGKTCSKCGCLVSAHYGKCPVIRIGGKEQAPSQPSALDFLKLAGISTDALEAIAEYINARDVINALPRGTPRDIINDYNEDVDIAARRWARLCVRDVPELVAIGKGAK